ncbi:UPF0316 protein [Desulfuromonas versatilis]|uniref:UPF0316 protein DESUT3_19550 n=1 Tax=Desulfuromonas versatilis TaxID=2802975 RepID=A0ABN6E161_9BACT|nr:DUF2179 domain-containing protein [Desulfuromonas versatilis]BCR04886.1 UPF0316 protein [Desulfuromonas versatilis]
MLTSSVVEPGFLSMLAVPLLVFIARILDVSIGTLRITFISRGLKALAAPLGFVESLIWVLAISQVMQHLHNWGTYLAFALGFGAGNYVGLLLEERLAVGNLIIRTIAHDEAPGLAAALWKAGFGVTSVDARGQTGPVKVIFTVAKRRNLKNVINLIRQFNPDALYTIEDVRFFNGALRQLSQQRK